MMKVLHIVPSYFPAKSHGGPIESVHNLNKWLVKRGVEVTVYTTDVNGSGRLDVPLGVPRDVDGVTVFYFPLSFRAWEHSCAMTRAIRKNVKNFDLVHITSVFLSASTIGARFAQRCGVPYIISPRGSLMKEPLAMKSALLKKIYLSLVEKKNLQGAAAIHFTTVREEKEYKGKGLPLAKGFIIPNSFDMEKFLGEEAGSKIFRKKWSISDTAPLALFLSRISWKKGLDTLIPAFAEVAKKMSAVQLVIAGGDEEGYKKNVEFLISNYKLQNRVIFTGMLTGADRIAAYREADVFVLPSYSENFGMAVVEALAIGLPAVITEGVAISDRIREKDAGIVVKKEVSAVAEAMLRMLQQKGQLESMVENGKRLVREEFSPAAVAERFEEAYKESIEK